MAGSNHGIKVVSQRTGLNADVIRIWERRYEAVQPERTRTNRRLYSEAQIQRLGLLRDLTQAGHSIGHMAKLPTEKLRELATEITGTQDHATRTSAAPAAKASFLDGCIAAVQRLDAPDLDNTLKHASIELGTLGLLQRVVAPLAQAIGELWREGIVTAAHEHFASAVLRVFLGNIAKPYGGTENAPLLIITTPAGQLHELGALIAGAAAANLGWQVTYLGASLPAAEIAGAARQSRARAVALSLVYPEDDPRLEGELLRLRELLPPETALLAGGRALPAYRGALDKIGARQVDDLAHLCSTLDEMRKPAKKPKR